eukprot:CAMPEP_0115286094 /NCGR_PEP_ID=MMETSP0270-20121206/61765_1 /TAXON_ID=71861 /ORGANISM="Scrippsiella trochoidea, Strain CCMP3099" /LENGTH=33 /DNA_ID= /DNA_START= /DNA_END= /DNA_ORIENTATION=
MEFLSALALWPATATSLRSGGGDDHPSTTPFTE